jgi:gliding motility-associated-like protein
MPNAGADNTTQVCNSTASVNLNTLLVGADAGGTWAETSASGAFNPATGVLTTAGLAAGAYTFTYTLTGVAPCPNDVSNFTVTVQDMPNAGADNTTQICNTTPAVNMNTLLVGADPGGVWAETSSSGAFVPATGTLNSTGLAAGVYTFTYTVAGVAPCPNDVANFSVTVQDMPDAGLDNSTQICNTAGSSVNLNTLLSGADAGGVWAETSSSGSFTPATGILNTAGLAAGAYTFTYTKAGVAPCPNDVSNFTVTVQQEVFAGADNSTQICNTAGSSVNLNTLLSGADPGGTWAETTASGAFTPATGTLNTSALPAGVYTFTYTAFGVAPCPNDVSNFTVTVQQEVFAGADNTTQICNLTGSSVDLNTLLSGADAGGVWVESTSSGTFTAATGMLNTSGLTAGAYNFNYTVTGVAPCPNDVSNFTVTVQQEVFAGADNATQICNTAGSSVNLNTLLSGADAGGAWVETTASASFTPATGVLNTASLTAGVYSFDYTVTGVAPCPNDVSTFTVTVEQEVFAGADNTTQACNYPAATVDLNPLLSGADAGGAWAATGSSAGFVPATGILNLTGLAAGTYTYSYTVTGVAPCPNDVSNFTVTVDQVPTVTPLIDEELCDESNHVTQLFTSDVPGTSYSWDNTTGTDVGFGLAGAGNIGGFTGSTGAAGDVVVTVEVIPTTPAGCVGNPVTFDITVHPLPVVNLTADKVLGCEPLMVYFTNLSTSSSDCVWSFGDGTTTSGCGLVSNVFETQGTYDVTLEVTSDYGCVSSMSIADYITVAPVPVASFLYNPTDLSVEKTDVEFVNTSLFADGYVWDFGDGSANVSATDPSHTFPPVGGASYTVMLVAESDAGCPDTTYQTIHIQDVIIFFIPNTFTPNGNGTNDVFKPVITAGIDMYDFHFTIFNRWGEIIFESFNPAGGWDGTYGDRDIIEDGVYVWQLEFGETMSDKKHRHRGHVTILK